MTGGRGHPLYDTEGTESSEGLGDEREGKKREGRGFIIAAPNILDPYRRKTCARDVYTSLVGSL